MRKLGTMRRRRAGGWALALVLVLAGPAPAQEFVPNQVNFESLSGELSGTVRFVGLGSPIPVGAQILAGFPSLTDLSFVFEISVAEGSLSGFSMATLGTGIQTAAGWVPGNGTSLEPDGRVDIASAALSLFGPSYTPVAPVSAGETTNFFFLTYDPDTLSSGPVQFNLFEQGPPGSPSAIAVMSLVTGPSPTPTATPTATPTPGGDDDDDGGDKDKDRDGNGGAPIQCFRFFGRIYCF